MKKLIFFALFLSLLIIEIIFTSVVGLNKLVTVPIFGLLLYLICRYSNLSREDIGLLKPSKQAVVWSVVIFCSLSIVMGLIYWISPDVLMDQRYNQSFSQVLISIFITIPITTVLLEELAFRGVLLGFFLKTGSRIHALLISSVVFGLWHITSSFDVRIDSFLFIKHPPQLLISIAIVLVTGAAGWAFSVLRLKTKSLLVPFVAHWSLNALAILFAWLAWQ